MDRVPIAEFDESKITTEPSPGSGNNVTVRYDGKYAGAVILEPDWAQRYRCAVSMERKGEWILQGCGGSESVEGGAKWVAYSYWLKNYYVYTSSNMREP